MRVLFFLPFCGLFPGLLTAQGQDSETYERDLQVIRTMLPGTYDNANQSYFDRRGDRSVKHRRIHMTIAPAQDRQDAFVVETFWDGELDTPASRQVWLLSSDDTMQAVRMKVWVGTSTLPPM